ncbi:MAG: HlyD family efflux transporter periplasmic adaptor subunit [Pseudomonadota bacterium]|nr:HlyD family efflux transporter periplasmic adaptor subunit [Pseudomonadota bacterium]
MAQNKSGKGVQYIASAEVAHPIKAARLLFTPPRFILRGPIYMVFIITVVAIFYMSVSKKSIIVSAPLVLERESMVVQAVGGGIITDVKARENMPVIPGYLLATIQERIRASTDPEQQRLFDQVQELNEAFDNKTDDYDFQISQAERNLSNARSTRDQDLAATRAKIDTLKTRLNSAEITLGDLKRNLKTAKSDLSYKTGLFRNHDITKPEYDRAKESVARLESEIRLQTNEIGNIKTGRDTAKAELIRLEGLADVESIKQEIQQLKTSKTRDLKRISKQIRELDERLASSGSIVPGVNFDDDHAYYRSTVNGTITDVHIIQGQLIDTGSPIVSIVRDNEPLQAMAYIQNKDIGHLRVRDTVQIKYFAYPYQEWGIQTGQISEIATTPNSDGLYEINIALDSETIKKLGGSLKRSLEIGLEGFAQIKTGEKRWIAIIFTPLSKFLDANDDAVGSTEGY